MASWGAAPLPIQPHLWQWRVVTPSAPSPAARTTRVPWTAVARRGAGVRLLATSGAWVLRWAAQPNACGGHSLTFAGLRSDCSRWSARVPACVLSLTIVAAGNWQAFRAIAGVNYLGQLGTGSTADSSVPVEAAPGFTFQALSGGMWHTCGIDESGRAFCWGEKSSFRASSHPAASPTCACTGGFFTEFNQLTSRLEFRGPAG